MKMFLAFLLCLCSSMPFLHADQEIVLCEKTYVAPDQIQFTESSFFVEIDGVHIQPLFLNADTNGIYFSAVCYAGYAERIHGPWQCKKSGCYTWNEEWRDVCKQCGTPRK